MWLEIRENTVQEVWRIFGSFKEDLLGHVRLFLQFFMKNSYFPLNDHHPKAGLMTRPFFRFNIFSTDITIFFNFNILLPVSFPIKICLILTQI